MTATPEHLAAVWSDIRVSLLGSTAGRLLSAHLAARYSVDGRLETVLAGDVTLDLPMWLADSGEVDSKIERHLLSALLCGFAAAAAPSLVGAVAPGEIHELASLLWQRSEEEMANAIGVRAKYDELADEADPIQLLVQLAVAAGAMLGEHRGEGPVELSAALSEALILERDVRELVPALRTRRINQAARRLAEHSGLDAGDESSVHELLGMAALGEGRQAVLGPWKEALDTAATRAFDFNSPELDAWIDELRARYQTVATGDASLLVGVSELAPLPLFGRVEPLARPPLDLAMHMARGFLLSDPDLAESWEVHRRGFLGRDVVAAPFPAGLVLEVLARAGIDVADRITRFLDRLAAQDFTYYDAPEFTWVETDTVGTVLRLLAYLEDQEPWRALMEPLVAQTLDVISTTGAVPVWLVDPAQVLAQSGMVLLGEGCGAIQSRLLVALLEQDPAAVPAGVVEAHLSRVVTDGLTVGVNYPPLFTAVAVRELLSAASVLGSNEVLDAAASLRRELESWTERDLSPMEAALLISACVDSPDEALVDRRIVHSILDAQDPDGGWPGEPLFFVPNKGGAVTWHRSRLLTTAFCFDALTRWSSRN